MLVAPHQSHTNTYIGDISSENDILYESDKNESQPSRLKWMAHIKAFNKYPTCLFSISTVFFV